MNKFFEKLASFPMNQILIIALVVAGGYYFLLYNDGSSIAAQLSGLQKQIAEQQKKKQETDAALKEAALVKDSVGKLSQQFQEVSRRLPTNLQSIDISKTIDTFVRSSGVRLTSKRPAAVVKKELVEEVPVSVVLEGSYAEIAQFIYQISGTEKMTRVKNFKLVPIDDKSGRTRLKFDGQIVGYRLAGDTK